MKKAVSILVFLLLNVYAQKNLNRIVKSIQLLLIASMVFMGCTPNSYFQRESARIVSNVKVPVFPKRQYNVQAFGAVADGKQDCRTAIMNAIAACNKEGGGKVVFPAGRYLVNGPIHLLDNVCLDVMAGAEILFGTNFSDYLPVVKTRWEGTIVYGYSPLVYAYQKKNLGITGAGTLNGQAANSWSKWKPQQRADQLLSRKMNNENTPLAERQFGEGHKLRPSFIQFYECENILVEGITVTNSPFWCIHPVFSRNITVANVKFDAQNANNDGIDPDSSEDVYIYNIDFDNHDDNIAIKSGRDREARELNRPSRNIFIRDCRWKGHNALAIGSEMSGGVYNVFVKDCTSRGKVISGVYLKSNRDRGGEISRVYIKNFNIDSCKTAIELITNYKNEGAGHPPTFSNVRIENFTCNLAEAGIILEGTPERPITNVQMKNVTINQAKKPITVHFVKDVTFNKVQINGETISADKN